VTEQALRRHKADHLPTQLVKAAEAKTVASADSLLTQVRALQEETLRILLGAADQRTALAAIAQARGNLQLLAQLLGELAAQPSTTVNVLISPHWITVRTSLMTALAPFPDARVAVAAQLLALENSDGRGR